MRDNIDFMFSPTLLLHRLHAIPSNDSHAQERSHATEYKRNNSTCGKASRQITRRQRLTPQISQVLSITSRIALCRSIAILASLPVILGDLAIQLLLQIKRSLNHGRNQTRGDVPLDVAVEEPHAGVVRLEAQDDVSIRFDEHRVAAHWGLRGCCYVGWIIDAGVFIGAGDELESVAVEMEGVSARTC